MHSHSIIPRALRQRATRNIDMAVKSEEGGKLAHGCLQPTLSVRAKTRRQTITSDRTPGLLCLSNPGRRQTAFFLLHELLIMLLRSTQNLRRALLLLRLVLPLYISAL